MRSSSFSTMGMAFRSIPARNDPRTAPCIKKKLCQMQHINEIQQLNAQIDADNTETKLCLP